MRGLFITGTDTGVGKTEVTCRIAISLRAEGVVVGAYKPVCTGAEHEGARGSSELGWRDVDRLFQALGGEFPEERICPQRFAAPLAPPAAARQEGSRVDPALLRAGAEWWRSRAAVLLVEGVGGLLSPLTESETVADLAADLGFPLVIVAADRLGTINHTLLTLEAARRRGLAVAGIVLNRLTAESDPSSESNADEIARRGGAPVLGTLPHAASQLLRPPGGPVTMDWLSLSGFPRH